jgi:tetratricopeptide (TPR) repeat protein
LWLKGDYAECIASLTEALRHHPEYADAYYARALSFEALNDYDRSLGDLQEVIQLQPGAVRVRIKDFFLLQPWESAQRHINCDIARIRGCRGMASLRKGEYELALTDFSGSIELDSKPGIYLARGLACSALHRYQQAIYDLMAVARTNPEDKGVCFDIYCRLAACYREIGAHKPAIFNAGIAIRLDLASAEPYYVRGTSYLVKGEYDKAITDLSEAIRLRVGWADAHAERAKAYWALGDETKAAEDAAKAAEFIGGRSPSVQP